MIRILAVADEVSQALYGPRLKELRPDLILGCGDLPFDYLEYLRAKAEVPLLYVHGNHDPSPRKPVTSNYLPAEYAQRSPPSAVGCVDLEDRWEDEVGLRIAGLGGSIRYNDGDNQFTQAEMRRRVRRLTRRARIRNWRDRRSVDVVIAHSPPLDCGDEGDGPHRGFAAFHRLIEQLEPKVMLHGHIHPHGRPRPDRTIGRTRIVNVIPYRLLEIEP
ncbi:MAG: metallophosphoesterase [Actinobacteria bacterium]|nr:metallophosphoesterase [Actinomycetota bacterium]